MAADLPALPRPASRQRTECRMGCGIVLTIVATCVMATHGGVRTLECAPRRWDWLLYVVYAEAAVALLCLAGLVFDDPGTVRRSRLTCEPVPPEARAKLQNMAPPNLQNVTGADGRTFCVRCYVWRPREPPAYDGDRFHAHANAHHCSTCQRCVTDFDHHCGVFGRCIAGDGFAGNMGYFKTLILMGVLGCATCVSFMFVSASSVGHAHASASNFRSAASKSCLMPVPQVGTTSLARSLSVRPPDVGTWRKTRSSPYSGSSTRIRESSRGMTLRPRSPPPGAGTPTTDSS